MTRMDSDSEQRLSEINPRLAGNVRRLNEQFMTAHPGDQLSVVQGLRSWQKQNALYAQGRTQPGAIVTQAPAGHSWHEFGLAVDVCPESLKTLPNWSPQSPLWAELAVTGSSLGMYPGEDFSHPDQPHFQMSGKFPVSPTDEVRGIFVRLGMVEVWRAAGLFA